MNITSRIKISVKYNLGADEAKQTFERSNTPNIKCQDEVKPDEHKWAKVNNLLDTDDTEGFGNKYDVVIKSE